MNAMDYSMFIFVLLISQLAPESGKNIMLTSTAQKEPLRVEYLKKEKMWSLSENGKAVKFSFDKKTEKLNLNLDGENKTLPLKDFIKMDKKIDWKKFTSLEINPKASPDSPQSPIMIKRNSKSVVFSQEKGFLSDLKTITMSWE